VIKNLGHIASHVDLPVLGHKARPYLIEPDKPRPNLAYMLIQKHGDDVGKVVSSLKVRYLRRFSFIFFPKGTGFLSFERLNLLPRPLLFFKPVFNFSVFYLFKVLQNNREQCVHRGQVLLVKDCLHMAANSFLVFRVNLCQAGGLLLPVSFGLRLPRLPLQLLFPSLALLLLFVELFNRFNSVEQLLDFLVCSLVLTLQFTSVLL
jgi:hypothetical protein